ncbi:hypothetical protein [Sheeppox virus]|uniref:Uncharacterized protein n=1 Tax=Sheeppox virus TaxID=10266 RepID=A0A2P1A998_SHEV|nr:hypothetical protein [Sheeppox virus]
MINRINLSYGIVKYIKALLLKENISESDKSIIKTIINESIYPHNYVYNILDFNSLTINFNTCEERNIIDFKDVNIKPQRFISYYKDYILESSEYMFIVCLKGETIIKCYNNNVISSNKVQKGEAFTLNIKTRYSIITKNRDLHLAIITYTTIYPLIYYKNIVFSKDSSLYNIFSGYKFALFRISSNDDKVLEDIIILNGRYYYSNSMEKVNIINIKTLLDKYNIKINSFTQIDYIPKSSHKACVEALELSLDDVTIRQIYDGTSFKDVCSISGIKYKIVILYCVLCYN